MRASAHMLSRGLRNTSLKMRGNRTRTRARCISPMPSTRRSATDTLRTPLHREWETGRGIHSARLKCGRISRMARCRGPLRKRIRDIVADSVRNRDRAPRRGRALAIERQPHHHAGAFARPARGLKLATVEIDEPFDNREPKAGAIALTPVSALDLEKRVADAREVVRRDTDPGVRDLKPYLLAIHARADGHGPAGGAELDGVGDQIDQYLHDGMPVGDDFGETMRDLDVERDAGLLCPQRQQFGTTCDDGIEANRLRGKSEIAGLQP